MGHIHRTALTAAPGGGVQTVPAPPAIAVETAAKTLRAACVQADGEVKALRLANESRRRAYKFARGLFDPAAVLVSAVKFLSAVGGDSLAQALLLQAKLDLARDAVDDGRPPDRVVYAVVGGQGSGVLAGRLFRDPWKIVRMEFRRSGSVWAMGRRGRNVLGIGFPRLCDETFILLRASVVGSCATKKDAYAARGDMSARSRRGL
jgi:homoserine kinase